MVPNHEDSIDESFPLKRADGLALVLNTPKGRGVFTSKAIEKGTVVEISPVLIFSEDEVPKHIQHTSLNHYTYYWPSPSSRSLTQALALGLGSLFNHSTLHQNVGWRRDLSTSCIIYTALRDIEAGEELCISYGSGRLWFPDADGLNEPSINFDTNKDEDERQVGTSLELELSGLSGIGIDLEEEKDEDDKHDVANCEVRAI